MSQPYASDNSDKYTRPTEYQESWVELYLSWVPGQIVDVAITVHDIPGGHIAVLDGLPTDNLPPGVDYQYLFKIVSGGRILASHDQSFPIYHLVGTPQNVVAGFSPQGSNSRANAVAL